MFRKLLLIALAILFFPIGPAVAIRPEVARLQKDWAEIKYGQPKEAQEQKFAALLKVAEQTVTQAPADPEVLIWYGIVESSYAGARGGIGALGNVKNAKASFERAIEINAAALDGSALTSLGSLYYQVPGWPLGFGDDRKAAEFLRKGLAVNPDGIDANYFYGDYLFRSGDYTGAEQALKKALLAPPRTARASADEGRRGEINQLLQKVAEKRR